MYHGRILTTLALVAAGSAQAQQTSARQAVIAADHALADSVRARGVAGGLAGAMTERTVLNWPGMAFVVGPEQARRALAAQPGLSRDRFTWQPLRVEVSGDSTLALMWGVIVRERPSQGSAPPELRLGRYLAAWQRNGASWGLAAFGLANLFPSSEGVWADSLGPAELPSIRSRGASGAFISADSIFAADAGAEGAATAFARWAAPDAVTFSGSGELNRGPQAIRATLEGDDSRWEWAPVAAGSSVDGGLGWTAGQATITARDGAPYRSKYLTLWMRQANGLIRFIADGGSGRP